jgi:micrococcal nuclease
MYEYHALVTKVYDGDTITVDIDLGFGIFMRKQTIRLYGIDTPEVRGEEREAGLMSRDWLRGMILDHNVILKTHKDTKGKYGRWLATVHLFDGLNVNEKLIELNLAVKAEY